MICYSSRTYPLVCSHSSFFKMQAPVYDVPKSEAQSLEITMMLSTDAATVQAAKVHSFGSWLSSSFLQNLVVVLGSVYCFVLCFFLPLDDGCCYGMSNADVVRDTHNILACRCVEFDGHYTVEGQTKKETLCDVQRQSWTQILLTCEPKSFASWTNAEPKFFLPTSSKSCLEHVVHDGIQKFPQIPAASVSPCSKLETKSPMQTNDSQF